MSDRTRLIRLKNLDEKIWELDDEIAALIGFGHCANAIALRASLAAERKRLIAKLSFEAYDKAVADRAEGN